MPHIYDVKSPAMHARYHVYLYRNGIDHRCLGMPRTAPSMLTSGLLLPSLPRAPCMRHGHSQQLPQGRVRLLNVVVPKESRGLEPQPP